MEEFSCGAKSFGLRIWRLGVEVGDRWLLVLSRQLSGLDKLLLLSRTLLFLFFNFYFFGGARD